MGMQTWEKQGLVFNPYADFFEFIPGEESLRARADDRYHPRTVLLDEVVPGEDYEVVISNFYGMALLRYRVGHLVRFLQPSGREQSGRLPPFTFLGRADDRIDLAGFTRLDEKSVWEALRRTGIRYGAWTARKEFNQETPVLHIYVELPHDYPPDEFEQKMHQSLKSVDPFYQDLETMLGIHPLRATLLPLGTFDRFYERRLRAGFELGKLTPPRMNAADEDIRDLLESAE